MQQSNVIKERRSQILVGHSLDQSLYSVEQKVNRNRVVCKTITRVLREAIRLIKKVSCNQRWRQDQPRARQGHNMQQQVDSRQRDAGRYQRDVSTLSLVAESRRSARRRRVKSVRAARSRCELVSRSVFLKYTESRVTRDKT